MLEDFIARIEDNYYFHLVQINGILAIIFYGKLVGKKKISPRFYLPFMIILLVCFYEILASYMIVNKGLNEKFHFLFTNQPFEGWNLWVYNIFNYQLSKLLLLCLIASNIYSRTKKKIVILFSLLFVSICVFFYSPWSGTPITDFQPYLYFLGNALIIISSGLFFVDLVTEESYLAINPLIYWPFWYITFLLFQSVLLFLADVAFEYISFQNTGVYDIFNTVSMILYLLLLTVFTIILATGRNFITPQTIKDGRTR